MFAGYPLRVEEKVAMFWTLGTQTIGKWEGRNELEDSESKAREKRGKMVPLIVVNTATSNRPQKTLNVKSPIPLPKGSGNFYNAVRPTEVGMAHYLLRGIMT